MVTDDMACPICEFSSVFGFETTYHRVHRCNNPRCRHLFAVQTRMDQGVMSDESDPTDDYSVYWKRNRHLVRYWQRQHFIREGIRILDVGSGVGHIVQVLKEQVRIDITCVEAGESYHPQLKKMGCRVYGNIADIPKPHQFDAALMIEVIEHLQEPVATLRQIKQCLRTGGKLFLTTPAGDLRRPVSEPWKLSAYDLPHHVQFFTPKSLTLTLSNAGFRNVCYRFVQEMYPNDDMQQSDYESLWAKGKAMGKQVQYWLRGSHHLTFFAE